MMANITKALEANKRAYKHVLSSVNKMNKYSAKDWQKISKEAYNLSQWIDKNWNIPYVALAFSNELKDWYWTLTRYYWNKEQEYLPKLKQEVLETKAYTEKRFLKYAERYMK